MGGVKGGGIIPLFTMSDVQQYADKQVNEIKEKQMLVFQKVGEDFIDKARSLRTYKDQTGNLRASIGYIIAEDGKPLYNSFKSDGGGSGAGSSAGADYAGSLVSKYDQGLVLIGVAGMNYALFVEARGYDVITGSRPGRQEMLEFLDSIK